MGIRDCTPNFYGQKYQLQEEIISTAIDIMIGGEDLGANLQELAENAKKNLDAGLDNLNVDQLAGQLNDLGEEAVNKLNEKLNSGIVPQGNMVSMMVMILMVSLVGRRREQSLEPRVVVFPR